MRRGSRPGRDEELRREWGQLLDLAPVDVGADVTVAAVAGADSLVVDVDEGEIFEDEAGAAQVNGQVVDFTDYDPDTGTLALADPLDAAVAEDDTVYLYDRTRGERVSDFEADVDIDDWDGEPLSGVLLLDGLEDGLPLGARDPGDGEEVLVEYDPDEDEWTIIRTRGLGRVRGVKWEDQDAYSLTADDVAAGTVTFPLSHQPDDRAVDAKVDGVPQDPDAYTVNYDQTLTWPLDGWEPVGATMRLHYTYRSGLARDQTVQLAGYSSGVDNPLTVPAEAEEGALLIAVIMLPSSVAAASNLNGYAHVGETEDITNGTHTYRLAVYSRLAPAGAIPVPEFPADIRDTPWVMAALDAASIATSVFATEPGTGTSGTSPAPAGVTHLRVWGTVGNSYGGIITPSKGTVLAGGDANDNLQINIVITTDDDSGTVEATSPGAAAWAMTTLTLKGS